MQIPSDSCDDAALTQSLFGAKQSFKFQSDKEFDEKQATFGAALYRERCYLGDGVGDGSHLCNDQQNGRKDAPAEMGNLIHQEIVAPTTALMSAQISTKETTFATSNLEPMALNILNVAYIQACKSLEIKVDEFALQHGAQNRHPVETPARIQVLLRKQGDGIVLGIIAPATEVAAADVVALVSEVRRQGHKLLQVALNGQILWQRGAMLYEGDQFASSEDGVQHMNQQW